MVVLLLVAGGVGLVNGMRTRYGRETWRVGPNCLEIRHTLFGRVQTQLYLGATLQIFPEQESRDYRSRRWTLWVQQPGRTHPLLSSLRRRPVCVFGEFLAEQTGWPLEFP